MQNQIIITLDYSIQDTYTNYFFSSGFSDLTPSVFIARISLTCSGVTWVRERQ